MLARYCSGDADSFPGVNEVATTSQLGSLICAVATLVGAGHKPPSRFEVLARDRARLFDDAVAVYTEKHPGAWGSLMDEPTFIFPVGSSSSLIIDDYRKEGPKAGQWLTCLSRKGRHLRVVWETRLRPTTPSEKPPIRGALLRHLFWLGLSLRSDAPVAVRQYLKCPGAYAKFMLEFPISGVACSVLFADGTGNLPLVREMHGGKLRFSNTEVFYPTKDELRILDHHPRGP